MTSILERHKEIWERKRILRIIYEKWYKKIISNLSKSEGKSLELGAGSGNFKEYYPGIISADIEKCEWLDMTFDAHSLPFGDNSLSNIVMIDVFHHLYNPIKFLNEAHRALNRGGRLIMLEPFPSPFSLMIYKRFHPEPFLFDVDYFSKSEIRDKDPWDSNQAIPFLIFFKHKNLFKSNFEKKFLIIKIEKQDCILYPASGGFENKAMIPNSLIPAFKLIEKFMLPLRSVFAFRCFIILEKKN